MIPPNLNLQEARQVLDLVHPQSGYVLSVFGPQGAVSWFVSNGDDVEHTLRELAGIQKRKHGVGLYYSLGEYDTAPESRGREDEVSRITSVWSDVDKLNKEDARERIKSFIHKHRSLKPSVVIDTGGGYQVLWLLREPVQVGPFPKGEPTPAALRVRAVNDALCRELKGDKVSDLARAFRLPGTLNTKCNDQGKYSNYTKPLPCRIVHADATRRYTLDDFDRIITVNHPQPQILTPNHRHPALMSEAARQARVHGGDIERTFAGVWQFNQTRCRPPKDEGEVRSIVEWVCDQERLQPKMKSATNLHAGLPGAIRGVMLDRSVATFDKPRQVMALVRRELEALGQFCRTQDGRIFFFRKSERRLYDLEQREFQHLLTQLSGLSATESGFRFAMDMLQANTATEAQLAEVHTLSHYNSASGLLAISDGAGGVWVRERNEDWQLTHNGDNGILFLTDPEATSWIPDREADSESLQWFFTQFMFANHPLTRKDQQVLLHTNLLHQFFPPLRRTRMIPAFLGPQGSAKTTGLRLIGRLFLGPGFDVTGLQRDREDAFVAAVTNRVFCARDNVDSRIPWLPDALAIYATGLRYRLRRLYTTNEEVSYVPRAALMISSRDPQFNRPDVAERLLPLYFERPEQYVAEEKIFRQLEARRGAIWGRILAELARIADTLPTSQAPGLPFRMADFAAFGWVLFNCLGKTQAWVELLSRLERAQAAFASEGDGVVEALRSLYEQSKPTFGPIKVSELFKECQAVAEAEALPFPKTTEGFGRRLTNLRRVIELELGVKFREERNRARRRTITLTGQDAEGAEVAEGNSEKV